MYIEKISWKNFGSYGSEEQFLNFDEKTGNLNLIIGENGSGKSTICSVLSFVLYGKVEGKNKPDLPNRINKTLETKIWFKSFNKDVYIVRGLSPNIFEIYVNGNLFENSNSDKLQEVFEKEILGMDYSIFKNVLSLSINDFKSLLSLNPQNKRLIFDKLFGFSILNKMKDTLKLEKKELEDNILENKTKINTNLNMLSKVKFEIESINEIDEKEFENNLKDLKDFENNLKNFSKDKINLEKFFKEKNKDKKELVSKITKNKNSLQFKKNVLDIHSNNSSCPHCHSLVNKETFQSLKTIFKADIEIEYKIVEESNNELEKVNNKILNLEKNIKDVNLEIQNLSNKINTINNFILVYNKTKDKNLNKLNKIIEEINSNNLVLENEHISLISELNFINDFENNIGDDGLKSKIINSILPILNKNLKFLCLEFKLFYVIEFDEYFNCHIYANEEISLSSLSTGQRKVADTIAIIAILKLLKTQYPTLNILFLDEVFSSLDSYKSYEIVKIFQNFSKELNLQIFLMNHAPLPSEYFDKIYEAKIENKFSRLEEVL